VITELEFKSLAAQGFNRIPLISEAFADLETPLSLYLKLAGRAPAAQLPAGIGGGGRALRPLLLHRPAGAHAAARHRHADRDRHRRRGGRAPRGQPAGFHRRLPAALQGGARPGLPRFCGGLAGYFGYDAVRCIEPKLAATIKTGGLDTPDILLLQTEELAVIDNLSGRLYLIVWADPAGPRPTSGQAPAGRAG
jgi:anthranilate synthase component 1